MPSIETVLLLVVYGLDSCGPTVFLLVVRYRSGSWKRAVRAGFLFATVGAFLITGPLAWLLTFPPSWGVSSYWGGGFLVLGAFGVVLACVGVVWQSPFVGYWVVITRAEARRHSQANNTG